MPPPELVEEEVVEVGVTEEAVEVVEVVLVLDVGEVELLVLDVLVELVVVAPPAAFTITVPAIHEWYTQWYGKTPGVVKV